MNFPAIPESLTTPQLANLSTQLLREELARALTLSAQTLQRLAIIWQELERRGEDLSDLRTGLASYLPLIAAGQLDAEVVVRFAGNKTLLGSISRLPVSEQHRLATGGNVEILTFAEDGSEIVTPVPAHALSATQARQIFADGWIRKPDEQRAVVVQRKTRNSSPRLAGKPTKISVDRKSGSLKIGRMRINPGELFEALAEFYPEPDNNAEREKAMPVRLSEIEHRRLKTAAAESGQSAERLMRLALRHAGLI